jgi:hypothetical protein
MSNMDLGGLIMEAELLLREEQTVQRENLSDEMLRICERLRRTLLAIQEQLDISRNVARKANTHASISRMQGRIDRVLEQAKACLAVPAPRPVAGAFAPRDASVTTARPRWS